ncbi:hypothetical protein DY037_01275 [Apilactobacillus micheneri]|uniref:Uncharacterized protein n=1 Tax=Apilactobacillus micheneri TaxID=1899430 RepID=A0A2S2JIY0_9LACO|nr:hypothetical protein [Apilactobacillus micheneri]TPR40040.1 hypothetical protein DY121_04165 [Apilactobacillus micheneri]TPR41851.1 hypothetical protein DY123_04785 [Apilactobacillus micheneri]TPR44242.1 hypothetical protein DY130_04160 [Apilactobacillus micheneri]TPR45866.1 hypothetical protein DY128_04160 [Apilactobacillus micheneri]TPR50610.1 hypothetical protein DY037_01275 [Apilactobacillus micheneri]
MKKIINISLSLLTILIALLFIQNTKNINIHASVPPTTYNKKELKALGFSKSNHFPKVFHGKWYNAMKEPNYGIKQKESINIDKLSINNNSLKNEGFVYNLKTNKKYKHNLPLMIGKKLIKIHTSFNKGNKYVWALPIYKDNCLWYMPIQNNRIGMSVVVPNFKKNKLPNHVSMNTWYYKSMKQAKNHYQLDN